MEKKRKRSRRTKEKGWNEQQMSRAILFLELDSFVETVGCRAEPIFVVTLRLAVVVGVVDGRSYEVPDQGAYSIHPYQAGPGHLPSNLFSVRIHVQKTKKRNNPKKLVQVRHSPAIAARKATKTRSDSEQRPQYVNPLAVRNTTGPIPLQLPDLGTTDSHRLGATPTQCARRQDSKVHCGRGRPSSIAIELRGVSQTDRHRPHPFSPKMSLPPELIHHILGHLSDDSQFLRAMSLVSKDWVTWCQTHLFKSVHLRPPTLKSWLKNVSPEVGGPASHTRTLILEEYRLIPWINPRYLDFPLSRLESFSDVRSLSLIQWNATLFNGAPLEPHLGHFGRSLRTLSLQFCTFNPVTFLGLLSLLPNVEDLEIAYPYLYSDTPETIPGVPDVSPSFRGTLSLGDLNSGHLILKSLAALPLHFSAIRIRGCTFYEPEAYQILLTNCRHSLLTLRFEESYRGTSKSHDFLRLRPLPRTSRQASPRRLAGVLRRTSRDSRASP